MLAEASDGQCLPEGIVRAERDILAAVQFRVAPVATTVDTVFEGLAASPALDPARLVFFAALMLGDASVVHGIRICSLAAAAIGLSITGAHLSATRDGPQAAALVQSLAESATKIAQCRTILERLLEARLVERSSDDPAWEWLIYEFPHSTALVRDWLAP